MKALTIRQPWAWAIIAGHKTFENRTWSTKYRGPLLIHAAKTMRMADYHDLGGYAIEDGFSPPELDEEYLKGGIVGIVDLVDIVTKSRDPWFGGPYGWRLENQRELPFVPWKGQQGLFEIPDEVVAGVLGKARRPRQRLQAKKKTT